LRRDIRILIFAGQRNLRHGPPRCPELDGDYFVDGLTDEIIRSLATIQGLQVRSRTSSFAFKDRPRNLHDVGEQLGANLVLDGSVLRSGNKLRINAQLFQVAGEVPLWAERFDRDLASANDVFGILDEISRAIVNKLRLRLGRGQPRYDLDLETYERYLKARALVDRRGLTDPQKGVELFEQVVATDPGFAPAYAGLANAYTWMSNPAQSSGGIPYDTAYSIMRPAAVRAIQLDPLLAEAHAAMGVVYSYERAWEDSEKSFRKAMISTRLSPLPIPAIRS
jgi:TolB-like protein